MTNFWISNPSIFLKWNVIVANAKITLANAYLRVTKSSNPCPSEFGNCSFVTNSGAKNIPKEKIKPTKVAKDKVIFGTDFPVLDFARTIKEIEELDINEVALKKLMYENTQKIYNL